MHLIIASTRIGNYEGITWAICQIGHCDINQLLYCIGFYSRVFVLQYAKCTLLVWFPCCYSWKWMSSLKRSLQFCVLFALNFRCCMQERQNGNFIFESSIVGCFTAICSSLNVIQSRDIKKEQCAQTFIFPIYANKLCLHVCICENKWSIITLCTNKTYH